MLRPVRPIQPAGDRDLAEQVAELRAVLEEIVHGIRADEAIFAFPLTSDATIGASPTEHTHVYQEALSGSGTSFMLASTPMTGSDRLWMNGLRLQRVGSAPALNEYMISGAAITLGTVKDSADHLVADYETDTDTAHTHTYHEALVGAGTGFTLGATPVAGSERVYWNGIRLRRVVSSPSLNEYTISGTTITLGFFKDSADSLVAAYNTTTDTTHAHSYHVALSGTGTSFTVPITPLAGSVRLIWNRLRLRQVGASPGLNEYTISGTAMTLGFSKDAADSLEVEFDT